MSVWCLGFQKVCHVGGQLMDEWKSLSEAWIVITLFFLFFCGGAKSIPTICMPVRLLTSAASWKIGPKSPNNTWPSENPHGHFCGKPKNIWGGTIHKRNGGRFGSRVTAAKTIAAKAFSYSLFQKNWDKKLRGVIFLPEVELTILVLQTTGKTHNNFKEI